jgi:hypothetical protein
MRTILRPVFSALLVFAATQGSLGAPALAADAALTDAREQAPAALIGPWKADLAASKYAGTKPKVALRTFAYTAEGKVLVTFMTLNAQGKFSTGHWAAQVDGTPAIEYHSAANSVPYNVVSFTKVDETTLNLIVTRHGKVDIQAVYKLSADGKTLTYSYGENVVVYRRWDGLD